MLLGCFMAGGACATADVFMDALLAAGVVVSLSTALLEAIPERAVSVGLAQILLSPVIAGRRLLREATRKIQEGLGSTRAASNRPVMRGIALATPVTVVFSLLLSNADPLLASWRDGLVQALQDASLLSRIACFSAFLVASAGSAGLALQA